MATKKVIIVMAYKDRQYQLTQTLLSLKGENFEVVIVDDGSKKEIELPDLNFPVTVLKITDKHWINGVPAYNKGIYYALLQKPDVIIIQNPECYHVGNIIDYARKVKDNEYISFGCFSLDEKTTFSIHDIIELSQSYNYGAVHDGQLAWYNHPVYRPLGYHFCVALTARNIFKLNGVDERFANGWGYEDNYFLHQVKSLGLKMNITEFPYVVHQWHYRSEDVPENKAMLVDRNKQLFKELSIENEYRAKHLYTSNFESAFD
jgi:glycosyltransferase involved in cell wall biosynthesis